MSSFWAWIIFRKILIVYWRPLHFKGNGEDPNPSMTVLYTTSCPSINHWYLSHFLSRSLVVCLLPSFSFFLFFYNYVFCIILCAMLPLYSTSKYLVWVWEWHFCGCKFDKCGFLSFIFFFFWKPVFHFNYIIYYNIFEFLLYNNI